MGPKQQPKSTTGNTCTEQDSTGIIDDNIMAVIKMTVSQSVTVIKDEVREIMNARFSTLEGVIADLKKQLTMKNDIIDMITNDNLRLKSRIDEIEAYNRIDNLIIKGLPETSFAEVASADADQGENSDATLAAVLNLCENILQVKINSEDISITHRLPKGSKDNFRPVIVRFSNRRAKDRVYAARRSLRKANITSPVFINEHLTKLNGRLAASCRVLPQATQGEENMGYVDAKWCCLH